MKNYTAKYSTSVLKNIEYAFKAENMESAIEYCKYKFITGLEIKITEDK